MSGTEPLIKKRKTLIQKGSVESLNNFAQVNVSVTNKKLDDNDQRVMSVIRSGTGNWVNSPNVKLKVLVPIVMKDVLM